MMRPSEDDDPCYCVGGATREKLGNGSGYGDRPSGGRNSLMEALRTWSGDNWNEYLAATVRYGHAFGEDAVAADFSGNDVNQRFLEVALKLPPT